VAGRLFTAPLPQALNSGIPWTPWPPCWGGQGRWISYCSTAAVRETLAQQGLQLAALAVPAGQDEGKAPQGWSGGSLASHEPWPSSPLWRRLSVMEGEHLACSAGEPYRDPTGIAPAAVILAKRQEAQAAGLASGAWRRRWLLERGPGA
jgi:hypothetical protein